jgi:hypothetical protein
VCGGGGSADALLNIALFVPLGAALLAAGLGASRALTVSVIASAMIEVAQATVVPTDIPR